MSTTLITTSYINLEDVTTDPTINAGRLWFKNPNIKYNPNNIQTTSLPTSESISIINTEIPYFANYMPSKGLYSFGRYPENQLVPEHYISKFNTFRGPWGWPCDEPCLFITDGSKFRWFNYGSLEVTVYVVFVRLDIEGAEYKTWEVIISPGGKYDFSETTWCWWNWWNTDIQGKYYHSGQAKYYRIWRQPFKEIESGQFEGVVIQEPANVPPYLRLYNPSPTSSSYVRIFGMYLTSKG